MQLYHFVKVDRRERIHLQKAISALLAFTMLMFGGCVAKADANKEVSVVAESSLTSDQEVYSMVIAKLPSPPVCKKIQDKTTMDKVLNYINTADKVPLEGETPIGWCFLISVSEGEDS